MRFAAIATAAAAVVGVPLAVSSAGPQMSGAQFMGAVQCVAYENAAAPRADLGAIKLRLNAEAAKQPLEIAVAAEREARAIGAAVQAGEAIATPGCGASRIADEGRLGRSV